MSRYLLKYDQAPRDYFHGVKPSDLARLDNRQLFQAGCRLMDSLQGGAGTPQEIAYSAEALEAIYRERERRRFTLR